MRFLFHFVRDNRVLVGRYIVIGLASTAIDYGFYWVFSRPLAIYYLWSAVLSFIIAASFNFTFNRNWTFQSNGKKRKQVPIFLLVVISGTFLNSAIIALLVEVFGWWDIWAKVIATGIVTGWNFFGNKYITFRHRPISMNNGQNP